MPRRDCVGVSTHSKCFVYGSIDEVRSRTASISVFESLTHFLGAAGINARPIIHFKSNGSVESVLPLPYYAQQ